MKLIKLTPDNVSNYIGREILFKTRGGYITKTIIGVSTTGTGRTIQIDHPDLKNRLEILSRNVYCIEE
jgi:hypothetical protein